MFSLLVMFIFLLLQTDQGIKNFSDEAAGKMAGQNPDYALQDLFDAIANENYVSSEII